MRSKKKNLIVVTYGFHSQEYFAEEVGKRIGEMNLENVVSVRFRPKCMPENIKVLMEKQVISWDERSKIDREGGMEKGEFVKRNFPNFGVHIDLHDDYDPERKEFLFYIRHSARDKRLKDLSKQIKRAFGDRIYLYLFRYVPPKNYTYRSITLDFFLPKIEGENHSYYYSKNALKRKEVQELLNESVDFTRKYIEWIKRYYLNPSKGYYEVFRLFQ